MSNPLPYLVRMLLFLAAVGGLAFVLHEDLLRVFLNTPILNGVIVGVLVIGIFFVMRQVISLWPEVKWLRRFQHREEGAPPLDDPLDQPAGAARHHAGRTAGPAPACRRRRRAPCSTASPPVSTSGASSRAT